jgi:5'-methylthioadenosine phosphorylase
MYRSWGADIIGMTGMPEAKLAREAEICYTAMAWITDYDCWYEHEDDVTVEMVVQNLVKNTANSREMIRKVVTELSPERDCPCATALKDTIITHPQGISEATKTKLAPIIGRYVS